VVFLKGKANKVFLANDVAQFISDGTTVYEV
jgi:hypothetical protein